MIKKVMKLMFIVTCIFLFFGFHNSSLNPNEDEISKVRFLYVNPYIKTVSSVKCNEFNKAFSQVIKEKIFTESNEIHKIIDLVHSAEIKNDTLKSLDIRFKIYFYNKNSEISSIVCGNLFGVSVGGKSYFLDEKDNQFLKELLDIKN